MIRLTRTSYELLEQEARRRGIDPEELVEQLLRADLGEAATENLKAAFADLGELKSGSPVTAADAEAPEAMSVSIRRRVDAGIIALAVAAAASTQIEAGSPVRAVLVFAAFLLVPGWAIVSLLDSGPPVAMLGLAIGLSLGVDVAGSLVLVWTGRFDVLVLTGIVGTVAVALLITDLVRQSQSSQTETPVPRAGG